MYDIMIASIIASTYHSINYLIIIIIIIIIIVYQILFMDLRLLVLVRLPLINLDFYNSASEKLFSIGYIMRFWPVEIEM